MKKMSLFGLLACSLLLSTTACSSEYESEEEVTVEPLSYPAPVDSTASDTVQAVREINAVNATETIKKMQPVM